MKKARKKNTNTVFLAFEEPRILFLTWLHQLTFPPTVCKCSLLCLPLIINIILLKYNYPCFPGTVLVLEPQSQADWDCWASSCVFIHVLHVFVVCSFSCWVTYCIHFPIVICIFFFSPLWINAEDILVQMFCGWIFFTSIEKYLEVKFLSQIIDTL